MRFETCNCIGGITFTCIGGITCPGLRMVLDRQWLMFLMFVFARTPLRQASAARFSVPNSKLDATMLWLWSHAHCTIHLHETSLGYQQDLQTRQHNGLDRYSAHVHTRLRTRPHKTCEQNARRQSCSPPQSCNERRHKKQLTSSRGSPGTGCGRWTGSASPGRTPTSSSKTTSLAQGLHHLSSCSTEGQQHPSCTSSP